jgi:hypothetical protein
MQKYDDWDIKLDIVTLALCETVAPKVFNSLDLQMTAKGTVGAPTCYNYFQLLKLIPHIIFLVTRHLPMRHLPRDICPETFAQRHLPRTTFAQKSFAQKDICPDGHLPRRRLPRRRLPRRRLPRKTFAQKDICPERHLPTRTFAQKMNSAGSMGVRAVTSCLQYQI